MSLFSIIVLAAIAVAAVYSVMVYNSLVSVKHNVSKAWANIDVLLKQRHDEIPKLVEVCKQYRQFEQDTLQKVIEARSKVFNASQAQNMGELGKAEALISAVRSVFPDKASIGEFVAALSLTIGEAVTLFLVQTIVTPLLVAYLFYSLIRDLLKPASPERPAEAATIETTTIIEAVPV